MVSCCVVLVPSFHRLQLLAPNCWFFVPSPLLEVPPPPHSSRGQWLLVCRCEALNDKYNFYNFFNAVTSYPSEMAPFPIRGNSPGREPWDYNNTPQYVRTEIASFVLNLTFVEMKNGKGEIDGSSVGYLVDEFINDVPQPLVG